MGDNARYLCDSRASCYTSKNNQEELRDHLVSTVCQNYQLARSVAVMLQQNIIVVTLFCRKIRTQ